MTPFVDRGPSKPAMFLLLLALVALFSTIAVMAGYWVLTTILDMLLAAVGGPEGP